MPQVMPKGTKCNRCNLPIAKNEPFVGCRFGDIVRFWHNRSRVTEDCWGKFLLDQVHHALHVGDVQTTKRAHKPSPRAPALS